MSFLKSIVKGVGNILTGGAFAQRDASKMQRKANEVQSKIEARQMQRERMQALRDAQIARAMGQQSAAVSGTTDSSGFSGSQAGMQASVLGNVAFSQQVSTGVDMINMYNRKAAGKMAQANTFAVIKQLGDQAANAYTGRG